MGSMILYPALFNARISLLSLTFLLLMTSLLLATGGCNGGPRTVEVKMPEAQARLMAIKDAYSNFIEQARRPPRDKAELLKTLESDNPDETLTSPRDGKPFVICYNVDMYEVDWAPPGVDPIIAYEQQGDGTRWVISPPGRIHQMEEADFQKARFPPGHKLQN